MTPCNFCSLELTKRQIQQSQKFCSRTCAGKAKTTRTRRLCQACGAATLNPKFCSKSCAAKLNNLGSDRWYLARGVKPKKSLQYTDCEFLWCSNKTGAEKGFCSSSCRFKFEREIKAYAWYSGQIDGAAKNGEISTWLVNWLKELVDYSCQQCGWRKFHPLDGAPGVQVDHIDGNNRNHAPSNLRVLCPECHWATDTYCGRNVKKAECAGQTALHSVRI